MGSIQIPEVKRKTTDTTPQLTTKASGLAAPIAEGGAALARATGATGAALTEVVKDYEVRIEAHKQSKREAEVLKVFEDVTTETENDYNKYKTERSEIPGEDYVQTFFDETLANRLSEAYQRLGGDEQSVAMLDKLMATERKRWGRGLAAQAVSLREAEKATKLQSMLGRQRRAVINTPSPDTLDISIEAVNSMIDEGNYTPSEKDVLKLEASQVLVTTMLSNIGPEEAIAKIDEPALGYQAMFKDAREVERFRSLLQTKADYQKKQAEEAKTKAANTQISDIATRLAKGEDVDPIAEIQTEAVKDDPKKIKEITSLVKNASKELKQEERERQYRDMITRRDLGSLSNADIYKEIFNPDDANKVIKYRDSIVNNPIYKEVVAQFKRDHSKAGGRKFGSGAEGNIEYTRQLRAFQEWMFAHPDEDPTEYYQKIMAPINQSAFERFFGLEGTKTNPIESRKRLEQEGFSERRLVYDPETGELK